MSPTRCSFPAANGAALALASRSPGPIASSTRSTLVGDVASMKPPYGYVESPTSGTPCLTPTRRATCAIGAYPLSYGYPAGMDVQLINDVVVSPE